MRLIVLGIALFAFATLAPADGAGIRALGISAPITPITAHFLHRNLNEAARRHDRLVLIEMDTPGGLDTAMREMVRDIMASPVPVVVYVAPSGARAASAGAIIALAADVAAMAPGTTIGAAHPVALGEKSDKTMEAKVVNDAVAYAEGIARTRGRDEALARQMVRDSLSVSAERALAGKVIDLIARDRKDLLQQLDGRHLRRGAQDTVLRLAGAEVVTAEMGSAERILSAISNPNIAYVLMMLGMMGLFFELSNPGAILPGVVGGICLILAFFAFQALPVNYAGILLILLALVFLVAEIKVVSHGMLTVGGVVSMILGSLLLFESSAPFLRVSWSVIAVTVLSTTGFFVVVITKALRVHRRQPVTGREGLIGQAGTAESGIARAGGKVFVTGEYWDAWSDEAIDAGSRITVEGVEGMRLKVKRLPER
ncbi:nodulation protein NfeD [Geobacter sp. SVR]|uniref:NfeD family protein n=1 Tax=Geobacter sp. SVR TaxID=2495594 RepID=UPI00143EFDCC|nr:nodulation protein NfeD [Geobacter sp. SVR]BCS54637.1 serine protease [Geobacter sp. SVR]GCF86855.1 serine protease [Geobacter sp. SVR]